MSAGWVLLAIMLFDIRAKSANFVVLDVGGGAVPKICEKRVRYS